MRIMPFGDSVVLGDGASGGFRTPLEVLLQQAAINFEFVGHRSENSYQMTFPLHEGWSRADLTDLRANHLDSAMTFEPDVILLYAGIEDLKQLPNHGIAVARLEKLIKAIHQTAPECAVLCSQLISSRDHVTHQKVKAFNSAIGTLVESMSSHGIPVKRVKMHAKVKDTGLNDVGLPNESGYLEMAKVWLRSIEEIYRRVTDNHDTV